MDRQLLTTTCTYEHRNELIDDFTTRYGEHNLVWYEVHKRMESAILRAKQLKKRSRAAKIGLIEQGNPAWKDLWPDLMSPSLDPGPRQSLPG